MRNFALSKHSEEAAFVMSIRSIVPALAFFLLSYAHAGAAQQAKKTPITVIYRYADVADFALASTVVAHVKIRSAKRLSVKLAQGVPLGATRYLVSADVVALIQSREPIPPRLSYVIDLSPDSQGNKPKISKSEMFIFALSARPGEVRLISSDAQVPWSPEAAQVIRGILAEANRAAAPPKLTGIASAFYTPGALPGEGETQIFLESANERPVSLTVIRAPDAPPRWYVSLGEMVDQAAEPPKRNTLLWYRLACTLPATLPSSVVETLEANARNQIADDYALIMSSLGNCPRARPRLSEAAN
jgi:hypothetical protein